MESVEEIKQPGRPQNAALRAAFPATVPVMTGFLVLGFAYGILMQTKGYGVVWAVHEYSGAWRQYSVCGRHVADTAFARCRRF